MIKRTKTTLSIQEFSSSDTEKDEIAESGLVEIDVYDPEGKYIYIIKAAEDISLERPAFYEFGFGIQEERDEMPIYVEYRIKNLPEIFGN